MIWSVSTAKMFERCQRQWFFKTYLAKARAKDEIRRRAYLLSKLQSVSAWRGSVVDQVLSQEVMPALQRKWPLSADKTIASAMARFDRQLAIAREHRLHDPAFKLSESGEDFVAFYGLEYDGTVGDEEIETARDEVRRALKAFFGMEEFLLRLRSADRLITQRNLTFAHADINVRAVPDVIVFSGLNPPAIIDWKVHVFGWRDAWLQLAVYAAALTRCMPHKDFPLATDQFKDTDIELLEVQLLTGIIRVHHLNEDHVARADAYIARTAESMLLSSDGMNGKTVNLVPTDFPAARYASACERCPYRGPCWETMQ